MAEIIQIRRDTAANWTSVNPVLAVGEIGAELGPPPKLKVGDGVTAWRDLAYLAAGGALWGSVTGLLSEQTDLSNALGAKAVAPGSNSDGYLPQWDGANSKTLKNGIDPATVVRTSGDQTVGGVKTFSSFPATPSSAPTTNYQVANKKYVDDMSSSFPVNTIRVSPSGADFTTLQAAIAHLDSLGSQTEGMLIEVDGGHYAISDTIVVDLGFPIKIRGSGASQVFFDAATGLAGKPMFILRSDCDFHSVTFDGSTLSGWKDSASAACVVLDDGGVYCECVDFWMNDASCGIDITGDGEVFAFNFGIIGMKACGICFNNSHASSGGAIDAEVGDFDDCAIGVHLVNGTGVDVFINTCRFLNTSGQVGITYVPATYSYSRLLIIGNDWNEVGTFISGFDFTLSRDANVVLRDNVGYSDMGPNFSVKVTDGASQTNCAVMDTWYKATFGSPTVSRVKFGLTGDNQLTYYPTRRSDLLMSVSMNVASSSQNKTLKVAIVKNGATGSPLNTFSLRLTASAQPFLLAFSHLALDIAQNDYFEIYYQCVGSTATFTTTDISWLCWRK